MASWFTDRLSSQTKASIGRARGKVNTEVQWGRDVVARAPDCGNNEIETHVARRLQQRSSEFADVNRRWHHERTDERNQTESPIIDGQTNG